MVLFNKKILLKSVSAGLIPVFFAVSFLVPQFFLGSGIYSFPASYSYLSQIRQYSSGNLVLRITYFFYSGDYSLYDFILSFFVSSNLLIRLSTSVFLTVSMILIYFISREINNNDASSLISLIIGMLIPSMWFYSVNSSLPSSFLVMVYLFAMLFFIRFANPKNKNKTFNLVLFLIGFFALMLSSTTVFIFLISIGIYLITAPIFKNKPLQKEYDTVLLLLGTTVLYYIILYSNRLFLNMPKQGFSFFVNPYDKIVSGDFVSYLVFSGIIPIIFVFYSLWTRVSHAEKMKTAGVFVFANLLGFLFFFYLRSVNKDVISLLTGFSAAALFPLFFVDFNSILRKSVFSERAKFIFYTVMILSIVFLGFTAYSFYVYSESYAPSSDIILAVKYIKNMNVSSGRIMSSPKSGDLISWFSGESPFITTKEYTDPSVYEKKIKLSKEMYSALFMNQSIDMKKVCEISHAWHIKTIFVSKRELSLIGDNATISETIKRLNSELSENIRYNCLKSVFDSSRVAVLEIWR